MCPAEGQTEHYGDLMISCMRVVPLADGFSEPPPELQAELREFCERRDHAGCLERSYCERRAFDSCHTAGVFGRTDLEQSSLARLEENTDDVIRRSLVADGD